MQNYSPLNLLTHVPLQNFNYSIIHDTAQEYRELYEHTRKTTGGQYTARKTKTITLKLPHINIAVVKLSFVMKAQTF